MVTIFKSERLVRFDTIEEEAAQDLFEYYLEIGYSIPRAVVRARMAFPKLSEEYFNWLGR